MKTFKCTSCENVYPWLLEGIEKDKCAYCSGKYPDGTICRGGK